MVSGGQPIRIGPFKGGLNDASDPTAIADDELASCENFEFDVDGALNSRPPVVAYSAAPVSETINILGHYIDANGTNWLLAATSDKLYYDNSGSWVEITTGLTINAMVQYDSKAWLIADPSSSGDGGSWVPTTTGAAGTWTTVSAIPRGSSGTIFKDRLYVSAGDTSTTNTSRLQFSNNGDPATWTSSDFIDVNPGDGQKLIDIFASGNALYCFKSDSTYVFSYDSAPTKGVLQPISPVIGTSATGCVVQYENTIFVYHEGFVYELVNYIYSKLNYKVKIEPSNAAVISYKYPISLARVGDRLVLKYFDKTYVFNLKTRTWTTWVSSLNFGRFYQVPKASTSSDPLSYVAGSFELNNNGTFMFTDSYETANSESMTCIARTKIFDFASPNLYKKLYWWGIDCIARDNVTGTVTPVIYSFSVTWGQLASYTWGDVSVFTWGQPLNVVPSVSDTVSTSGSVGRKFLKMLKAIRFRSVYFEVSFSTNGTPSQAPVKLFTINPVINSRQQVVKTIS